MDTIDTILLGRVTYEMFAAYWPDITSGEDKPFADKLNAIPKVVFSGTLARAPWGDWEEARVVGGGATEEVARLRQAPGKDMVVWGSIGLAQSLIDGNLIDEYQLIVCPVVLGTGRPLFRGALDAVEMRLRGTQSFDRGAVLLAYAPHPRAS